MCTAVKYKAFDYHRVSDFSRWRISQTTCFGFSDGTRLGTLKSICAPYCDETPQYMAYYYFRFLKTNGYHIGFLFFGLDFDPFFDQISSKSNNARQSYDVISIFQDGGRQPCCVCG